MELVINAVIPTFGIMLLGAIAGKFNFLGEKSDKILSNFVYYFSLPAVLFISCAQMEIQQFLNIPFISAYSIGTIVVFILVYVTPRVKNNRKELPLKAMSVASPNTAFMGIPVLLALVGPKAMLPVVISTIILAIVLCFAIILIELTDSNKNNSIIKTLLPVIFKNPIILSIIFGFIVSILNIKLPECIISLFKELGQTCGPTAMFAIGIPLTTLRLPKQKRQICYLCFLKLIIMPLVTLPLLILFGASNLMIATGFILSAMPVAATTFIVAQQYGIYVLKTTELIILSTIISVITLSIAIIYLANYYPNVLLQ